MADKMVRVTTIHKKAVPNTKVISSSVVMITILGLHCVGRPPQIHINAA